jgi:predicted Zn-dependent protease
VAPAARGFAWAVTVVANPEPSLVVYPRGRIVVHDAFVAATGWLDEELAAIVAHAIAHSLLGHDTQRIAQRAGAALDAADPSRRALAIADAAEALRTTRYTREELAAADALMIDLLVQAAYDPRAAGSAWRRARGVRPIAERMPIDDERLAAIDAAARAALPRYEDVRAKAAAQGGGVRIPAGTHRAR